MKVDVTQAITGFDGKEALDQDKKTIPLRAVLVTALNTVLPDESVEDKLDCGELAVRIAQEDTVEIGHSDVSRIKGKLGHYTPLIVLRVCEALNK